MQGRKLNSKTPMILLEHTGIYKSSLVSIEAYA